MQGFSTYVGLDVHKNSISIAIASEGSREDAISVGKVPNDATRLLRLLRKLGTPESVERFVEGMRDGSALVGNTLRQLDFRDAYRRVSLVFRKSFPRKSALSAFAGVVLTTPRATTAARKLARFLRSGDLTSIRVPTPEEEALRDLIRAREDTKRVETNVKRRLGALLRSLSGRQEGHRVLCHQGRP